LPTEYIVEIAYRPGVFNPHAERLSSEFRQAGVRRIREVHTSQIYRINGSVSRSTVDEICDGLLCDPVTQMHFVDNVHRRLGRVVDVWFRPGVTDVVGESVMKGIRDLGYAGVEAVGSGQRVHFLGGTMDRHRARDLARQWFMNPLIQEINIW